MPVKHARVEIDEKGMVFFSYWRKGPHRKVLFRVEEHTALILNPETGEEEVLGTVVSPTQGVLIIIIP